jgi:translation initiation factor IF-3
LLKPKHRLNRQIRAESVRVVHEDRGALGVMPTREALQMALDEGYDLVELSPNAEPPVCKIMNYGKYCYEQEKKAKLAKKKQKIVQLKELMLRPNISPHDLEVKLNYAKNFINNGDKVKFSLRFKGREASHQEIGFEIFKKITEALKDIAKAESNPKFDGKVIMAILSPIDVKE